MTPRGKIQPKRLESPRRCSVCDKTGHNKRRCPNILVFQKKKIVTIPKQSYIAVQFEKQTPTSPHIVQLKKKKKISHWDSVSVMETPKGHRERRAPVDFAALVRNANSKQTNVFSREDLEPASNIYGQERETSIDILNEIAHIDSSKPMYISHSMADAKRQNKKNVFKNFPIFITNSILNAKDGIAQQITSTRQRFSFKRLAVSIVTIMLLATLPFPAVAFYQKIRTDSNRVVGESTNAFLSLQSSTIAAFHNNLPQAQYDLNAALNAFSTAEEILDKEYKALIYVASAVPIVGDKVSSRQDLLVAGHHLALGNTYLVKGITDATTNQDGTVTNIDRLDILRVHIRGALPQYEEALSKLNLVETSSLPVEYQNSFEEFKTLFAGFIADMGEMLDVIDGIQLVLGSDGFKRYLVLFQNHHEIRPTGGFVGSFATVDVQSGKILKIDIPAGGSYDLQGQMDIFLKPPVPLQLVNSRWEFQDGNWFPDFKVSAQKMAWFYQHARFNTVDGVIAINASVLERLLRVLGPMQNEDYNLLVDSEDVLSQLEYEIESYDGDDNAPKAIISALFEQVFASINSIEPSELLSLVMELHEAAQNKEIQFYFNDEKVQNIFNEFGWTGEIIDTSPNQDYLMVVNANVGGGKSDASIIQNISQQTVVQEDGSVINTVFITREHTGSDIDTVGMNQSYLRIYVPENSELLDAGGFTYPEEQSFHVPSRTYMEDTDLMTNEIEDLIHVGTGTRVTREFGKSVFGNWVVTEPGQKSNVYFVYKLPFNVFSEQESENVASGYISQLFNQAFFSEDTTSRYSSVFQQQSGAASVHEQIVIYPDSWLPVWKSDEEIKLSINGGQVEYSKGRDHIFGIVMKKNNQ